MHYGVFEVQLELGEDGAYLVPTKVDVRIYYGTRFAHSNLNELLEMVTSKLEYVITHDNFQPIKDCSCWKARN